MMRRFYLNARIRPDGIFGNDRYQKSAAHLYAWSIPRAVEAAKANSKAMKLGRLLRIVSVFEVQLASVASVR
jgi:hypothetical protein